MAPICRFCGKDSKFNSSISVIKGYELFKCSYCGSIGVLREPAPEEIEHVYDELFSTGAYIQHRSEYKQVLTGESPYSPYRKMLLRLLELKTQGRNMIEI